ncbi:MAG: hypothetical protein PHP86_09820 [Nevskiales bacterium]|nr:hypothetical protein [Nevskiales bacterium]
MLQLLEVDSSQGAAQIELAWTNIHLFKDIKFSIPSPVGKMETPISIRVMHCNSPSLPDYFRCGPLHLVSAELKVLLQAYSSEVEYLPVEVELPDGSFSSHSAAHFIHAIPCLDRENTIGEEKGGYFFNIKQLRLHDEDAGSAELFVVAEAPFVVCVGRGLQDALGAFSGISLISQEQWKWYEQSGR